ncbi:MAG: caspase family protein [Nostoc sp.]|uniref:nSTAND1 domain-containing NTPase n=1 Tax=Nostoc sp. TaxID=1180 RepID=UPI002FF1543D
MRRAFVMGSNGPVGPTQLRYALNDVEKMRTLLSEPRCDFKVESPSSESNIWSVYEQLAEIASSCDSDDTFICHFSGHGRLVRGSLFLLWNDSDTNKLPNTALSVARIMETLSYCKAQSRLLILDCCHAGAVVNMPKNGDEATVDEIIIKPDNYLVLVAGARSEKAREIEKLQGGFLTVNICDAIGEKIDEADLDKDGRISIDDLKKWLENRFKQYNQTIPQEYHVPLPYLYGQYRGEIFLTLPSSNNLHVEAVVDSEETSPYQALDPFSKKTAGFFFGRKQVVKDLKKALEKSNLVLLVGNSGSGKSSVVKAGLTPELEKDGWQVLEPVVPWVEPVSYLKYEIAQRLFGETEKIKDVHNLIDTNGLASITQHIPGEKPILIIIDQFEEVFTVCSQKSEQRRFIELLTKVAYTSVSRLKVIATLRADFVQDCLKHPPLAPFIQNQSVFIPELEDEDLKQVIIEPANNLKYSFDEGLVESIMEQISQEENFLPLLQFALTELWKGRDKKARKITANQYLKKGGILGVLNRRAEEIYRSFNEQEKVWTKRIFMKLVRTGVGEKDTRQRQPKQKLLAISGNNPEQQEAIQSILNKLIKERLLVTGNDIEGVAWIDLAHEALMEGWAQFSLWRKENRELRRLCDKVEDAHREWLQSKKDPRFLMMGGLLVQIEEKWSDMEQELSDETKEFYELSKSSQYKIDGFIQQKLEKLDKEYQLEIHKYQIESLQSQLETKEYRFQLDAKEAQIEIYKEHNQSLEKIISILAEKPNNIVVRANVESKTFDNQPKEHLTYNFQGANISGDIVMNNYASEQKQSLAEAAAEIQKLLEQLDKTYSKNETAEEMTTSQKMAVASEVIERIERDPTLKQRLINALKAGGTEALKELLNHPASSFVIGAVKGWQKDDISKD